MASSKTMAADTLRVRSSCARSLLASASDVYWSHVDFTLSGGQNQLFYSRRVGRAPQGATRNEPTGAAFTDVPANATILGAAKLTGRTAGGWSFGFMEAFTP